MVVDSCKFFDVMTAKYTGNDSFPRFWLSLLQTFLSWKSMQAASPSVSKSCFL